MNSYKEQQLELAKNISKLIYKTYYDKRCQKLPGKMADLLYTENHMEIT